MNQEKINKQIFKRLDRIEKSIFKGKSINKELPQKDKDSLTDIILRLRDNNFFNQPHTAEEVHKKLSPNYPCKIDRVATALKRLKDRKELRVADKLINNKKMLAYVW